MQDYLVVVDTPGIKGYVFGTPRLREIQGASALLDRLNREETRRVLREHLGERAEVVFLGGGSGQLIVRGAKSSEIDSAFAAMERVYREHTGGAAEVVWGAAPLGSTPGSYREAMDRAYAALRAMRTAYPRTVVLDTWPLARECESASVDPVVVLADGGGNECAGTARGDDISWLGVPSLHKRREAVRSRKQGLWNRLETELGRNVASRVDDERLFGEGQPVALLYSDGDRMGSVFREAEDTEQYQRLSSGVEKTLWDSLCAGVKAVFPTSEFPDEVPFLPLLLAGDDLVAYVRGDRALRLASALSNTFTRLTDERLGLPLTISIGIAVAKPSHPFYSLLETAEQLLSSAKKQRSVLASTLKGEEPPPQTVDLLVTSASSFSNLQAVRERDRLPLGSTGEEPCLSRSMFPCTVQQLEGLLRLAETLFRSERAMPRSRVQALYEAAYAPSRAEASLRAIEALGRADKVHRRAIISAMDELCSSAADVEVHPESGLGALPFMRDGRTFYGDLAVLARLGFDPRPVKTGEA
jgi:hypothetical protein